MHRASDLRVRRRGFARGLCERFQREDALRGRLDARGAFAPRIGHRDRGAGTERVHAGVERDPRRVGAIARDAVGLREVDHALGIRDDRAREAQLVAKHVAKQPRVRMGRDAVDGVARRDHRHHVRALDGLGEGRDVDAAQFALGHGRRARALARKSRPGESGRSREHLAGRGAAFHERALQPVDGGHAQFGHEEGILAEGFLDAAAARVAPHGERGPEHDTRALRAGLGRGGGVYPRDERRVPRCGECQRRGHAAKLERARERGVEEGGARGRRHVGERMARLRIDREARGFIGCRGPWHASGDEDGEGAKGTEIDLWHDFAVALPFFILTTDRMNRNPAALPDLLEPLARTVPAYPPGAEREDGYDLWLRYRRLDENAAAALGKVASCIVVPRAAGTTILAAAAELHTAITAMRGEAPPVVHDVAEGAIVLATDAAIPHEGYAIGAASVEGRRVVRIAGGSDVGVLYGAFAWLREVLMGEDPAKVALASAPKVRLRMLNHWDNLDRTIERGYAGQSIWDWWKLPGVKDRRYLDYARAMASLGLNAASVNNVSSKPEILLTPWIAKVRVLADIFRPYGIRIFLAARFSAPKELGGLATADPLDAAVRAWWKAKVDEIYASIPDFGGFLVKANSEGQPGPHDYGRNHADGANMLADAIGSRGTVVWRAFVYSPEDPQDRHKQAYTDFKPLDGKFAPNVMVQVKNGAIDFQPREPFHPMFGAMPATPLAFEVQVTKEYLGFATHLAYLGTMYEEALQADTFAKGPGSLVAKVADGSLHGHELTGMAAVSNVGVDRNWCGSHFDQANWYAFGRLAWDPYASARDIAREWVLQTFTHERSAVDAIVGMMMDSREAVVRYMMPLGLHHLFDTGHHHGPGPWVDDLERPEWNPAYYHQADRDGIGFDRSPRGSNAVGQYAAPLARAWGEPATTPDNLLLWFHHLPWGYRMASGKTLWESMVANYDQGVAEAKALAARWEKLEGAIDPRRYAETAELLAVQAREAKWWRDACLAYFSDVNDLEFPASAEAPPLTVAQYRAIAFPYAPGRGG